MGAAPSARPCRGPAAPAPDCFRFPPARPGHARGPPPKYEPPECPPGTGTPPKSAVETPPWGWVWGGPQPSPLCPTNSTGVGGSLLPAWLGTTPSSLHPQNPAVAQGPWSPPPWGPPGTPPNSQLAPPKPGTAARGAASSSRALQDTPEPWGTPKQQEKPHQDRPKAAPREPGVRDHLMGPPEMSQKEPGIRDGTVLPSPPEPCIVHSTKCKIFSNFGPKLDFSSLSQLLLAPNIEHP